METANGKVAPWKNSDIKEGDMIIKIDGVAVRNNDEIINELSKKQKNQILSLVIKRKKELITTNITVVESSNNSNSLGLYIKDKIKGVGTLTFINPQNNKFGALGHSVTDQQMTLDNQSGLISSSQIKQINRATPGNPGEKQAIVSQTPIGEINQNINTGVYGTLKSIKEFTSKKNIKAAKQKEIFIGKAEIWTVIEGKSIGKFEVKIIQLQKQSSTNIKGIKFVVSDQRLISKTGGIIQGMSGSPIIQDNKIIGAVSHVVVDSPEVGYGVYIEFMIPNTL